MDRIIRFVLGPLLNLGGLWFIAMPFGFATMRFGDRVSPPPWGEYLGEVFRGGASSIAVGLILVIGGLFAAASHKSPPGQGIATKAFEGRDGSAAVVGLLIWVGIGVGLALLLMR